jgi:hypothetical protein
VLTLETEMLAYYAKLAVFKLRRTFDVDALLTELLLTNGKDKKVDLERAFELLRKLKFDELRDFIYLHVSYHPAPFRLYDRKKMYEDLRLKLLNNLLLAERVAERNGTAIIRRYKSLSTYFAARERKLLELAAAAGHQEAPEDDSPSPRH